MAPLLNAHRRFASERHRAWPIGVALASLGALTGCAASVARYAQQSTAADSAAHAAVARERTINANAIPANTVGVLPLRVQTADTTYSALGYGLAALMASDLARSERLVVVERLHLDAVIRELDLMSSGAVDSTNAPRVGKLVGARRVVLGDLVIRPDRGLTIGSKVANATSGRVDASLNGAANLDLIFDAEKSMVFRLFDAMGVTLTPAERRAIERRPTRSIKALLAYSNGIKAELGRNFQAAVQQYNSATAIDPGFREALERAAILSNRPVPTSTGATSVDRVSALTTDLVNRPTPVVVGSGVDAPVSRQQLLTITILVRTP